MMKKYNLGCVDMAQYEDMTFDEIQAWLNPERESYHSLHVERMNEKWFRWRDSNGGQYYIGDFEGLCEYLQTLRLRKIDLKYQQAMQSTQVLKVLSQTEIDDLLSDI